MLVSDFNYNLPEGQIAQEPPAERAGARMLYLPRDGGLQDLWFRNLPDLLQPEDLLVVNNTRVFPARLFGRRSGSKAQPISPENPAARDFLQGRVEVLLTKQVSKEPNEWECLVRPGRKVDVGEKLLLGPAQELHAEVIARGTFGERRIRFHENADFYETLDRIGHVPLPPYIARDDQPADRERYQTVYAQERGSVAAPTAGLHFTPAILNSIRARGVEIAEITLHVGLGTFQPVHEERVEDHRLHRESYRITEKAAGQLNRAIENSRRIVAVGTTAVRTLEFAARQYGEGRFQAQAGEADLFIYPSFEFRVVGALLTNFHLPQSTLLMLVSAFGGHARIMHAYRHAVEGGYRFYSYGDCMFVEKPA